MGGAPGEPQYRLERVERARPDVAEDHSQCREAENGQASGVRPARYRIDSCLRQRANSGNREGASFRWQQKHVGNLLASREIACAFLRDAWWPSANRRTATITPVE